MGKKDKNSLIRFLPMYGCFSTGILYSAIGVIALLSFFNLKDGGADETSLLVYLNDFLAGRITVWVILIGTLSYFAWRIYESFADPYRYGTSARGIIRRVGIGFSSIPDGMIAYSAIQVLFGVSKINESGPPVVQRQMVSDLLESSTGKEIIIATGITIVATAVIQWIYGFTSGYRERIDAGDMLKNNRLLVSILGKSGYAARGLIIGIIGWFYFKAGISEDAQYIVNTDKAFDHIGDEWGHFFFIITALGTIAYGFFMFLSGWGYDADEDKVRGK